MPGVLGQHRIGTTDNHVLDLYRQGGASLAGVYDGTETFTARLWTGDDQAPLATLTAAWDDRVADNPAAVAVPRVLLTIPEAVAVASLVGFRRVAVDIHLGDDTTRPVYDGLIEFIPGPTGEATAPATICSTDRVLTVAPWARQLVTTHPAFQSDLAEQRHEAWVQVRETILARARFILERQLDIHSPVEASDPIIPLTGADAGGWYGPSLVPDTTLRDQLATLRGYLDASPTKLMTADGQAPLIAAHLTAAMLADHQVDQAMTGQGSGGPMAAVGWKAKADHHRGEGLRLMRSWIAQVDTDDDGAADWEFPRVA